MPSLTRTCPHCHQTNKIFDLKAACNPSGEALIGHGYVVGVCTGCQGPIMFHVKKKGIGFADPLNDDLMGTETAGHDVLEEWPTGA